MLSTQYLKDPTDPAFKDDAGMKQWRDFMAKYMPGGDVTDASYVFAYGVSLTMLQVLKQCNGDFSRDNVMKQAENLHDFELPVLLPGIKMNTSPPTIARSRRCSCMNGTARPGCGSAI